MRARIIALIILIVLVVLPASLYWYFTAKQTSSVTVSASGAFLVTLRGTFGIDNLPLADSALGYSQRCDGACTITPVLPAIYEVTLQQTGSIDRRDTLSVGVWAKVERAYVFTPDITLNSVGNIDADSNVDETLLEKAREKGVENITPIGRAGDQKYWVVRQDGQTTHIGVLTEEGFARSKSYAGVLSDIRLDISRHTLIVPISSDRTILLSTDLKHESEVLMGAPDILNVEFQDNGNAKIRTKKSVFDLTPLGLEENIRFSDYIDLSPEVRIWYIDKDDTNKLSLSNFDPGTSILVRVDRTSPTSNVLRKGIDIQALVFHQGKPAYIDSQGGIFTIQ